MKNRFDLILLLLFCISIPACKWAGDMDIRWLLILPGVSVFLLQLLICRRTGERGLRGLPAALLLLFALTGAAIALVGENWDSILGLIMLIASIGPAAAIVLAWSGHTLYVRRAGKQGGP